MNVENIDVSNLSQKLIEDIYQDEEFKAWMITLRDTMVFKYNLPSTVVFDYGKNDNWLHYYLEGYSPFEAISEDSTYWEAAE